MTHPTSPEPTRLLMVDDDTKLVALVREYLEPQGFEVEAVHEGPAGLAAVATSRPALVILDLMLPGLDGLEVCRRLRSSCSVPVLMLTARGDETDRIVGLEVGADDYLPKPFNPRELLARIRAILRRVEATPTVAPKSIGVVVGDLAIDPGTRRVVLGEVAIDLTTAEFDILLALARHAGRVVSRDRLLEEVHGPGWAAYERSVDVHVSRIRQKLEADPRHPQWLKTVRGVGYQLSSGSGE